MSYILLVSKRNCIANRAKHTGYSVSMALLVPTKVGAVCFVVLSAILRCNERDNLRRMGSRAVERFNSVCSEQGAVKLLPQDKVTCMVS